DAGHFRPALGARQSHHLGAQPVRQFRHPRRDAAPRRRHAPHRAIPCRDRRARHADLGAVGRQPAESVSRPAARPSSARAGAERPDARRRSRRETGHLQDSRTICVRRRRGDAALDRAGGTVPPVRPRRGVPQSRAVRGDRAQIARRPGADRGDVRPVGRGQGGGMKFRIDWGAYYWPALAGFAILFVANIVANPIFISHDNWRPVLLGAAPFIITTWAQTVPIMSGNGDLDLSVGPLAGLVNAVMAMTLPGLGITDPFSMIAIALAIGVASGLLNGFLVTIVRVQPIIATLGTFLTYQGLTLELLPISGGTAPPWMKAISGNVAGIPGVFFVFVLIAVAWWLLGRTAYRRNLLAVGRYPRRLYRGHQRHLGAHRRLHH